MQIATSYDNRQCTSSDVKIRAEFAPPCVAEFARSTFRPHW